MYKDYSIVFSLNDRLYSIKNFDNIFLALYKITKRNIILFKLFWIGISVDKSFKS